MGVRARQGQVVLKVAHLVHLKGEQEALDVEPQEHQRDGKEEPLPVQEPLGHRLAPLVPAQGVVFERVEQCAVEGGNAELQLLLCAGRLGPQLDPQAVVRAHLRVQVQARARGTLRSVHPVAMKTLKKDQREGENQETPKQQHEHGVSVFAHRSRRQLEGS